MSIKFVTHAFSERFKMANTLSMLLLTLLSVVSAVSAASNPHVLFVVADDLGYNDLGYHNNNQSHTPVLNDLISTGVWLSDYYTFKVCAPTRTSIMIGRYPWRTGYYDMIDDGGHCVDPGYKMLPELLKPLGYATHAIGKWDVGMIAKHCTPTYRGFDTFLGYYTACVEDYWYHFAPSCNNQSGGNLPADFTMNEGTTFQAIPTANGTYDAHVFTERAITLVNQHAENLRTNRTGGDDSLFIYLAYQNVHLGCGGDIKGSGREVGVQAPCETVDLFPKVTLDLWKGQSANLLELDYGVGNVTAAYKKNGLWDDTVFILVSDNGGPLDHTANYPLRGGKHTFYEGGVRVVSFVNGGQNVFPSARRGSIYSGMMHSSDWYKTIVAGLAGGTVDFNQTGPSTPDGYDCWHALTTDGASPRTEVIHQVENQYFNDSSTGYAIRMGNMKLIMGDPGDNRVVSWPQVGDKEIPFGQSGGVKEENTNHCRVGPGTIPKHEKQCEPYCLFDLSKDLAEAHDLSKDPSHSNTLQLMIARLKAAAKTGGNPSLAYPYSHPEEKAMDQAICQEAYKTGVWEPLEV
eukprot:m.89637 g.89637  ORF g.89637 m.89637 type:complete len:574 (-) comp13233_c0_seq2:193-1914(-)